MIGGIDRDRPDDPGGSPFERFSEQDQQFERHSGIPDAFDTIGTANDDYSAEPYVEHYPLPIRILIFVVGSVASWALVFWAVNA
jgi:uncharacterized membrane protein